MKLIIAPEGSNLYSAKSVFLGGGITNCPNWQKDIVEYFKDTDLNIFNPRQDNFDINNTDASNAQIEWEYKYLNACEVILFWFPEETLCPITLYELGKYTQTHKNVFVGCHANYKRKFDVVKQLSLSRPDIKVVFDIPSLAKNVRSYFGRM